MLTEVREAAAALQAAAADGSSSNPTDRLSSILMKLDLAAEATSAAAEAITDAMISDGQKGRQQHLAVDDQSMRTPQKQIMSGTQQVMFAMLVCWP